MAALPITKKQARRLSTKLAELSVAEELFTTYLAVWTRQEVQDLITQGNLVVLNIPAKNGYRIGKFEVADIGGAWEVTNSGNDNRVTFGEKKSAVFYCLLEYKNMYNRSKELLFQDNEVYKLELDQKLYRHKYKQACQSKDSFGQDLCRARLSDINPRLGYAREQLEKLINSAKYIKIWDKQP
jgi:hypothetical protein